MRCSTAWSPTAVPRWRIMLAMSTPGGDPTSVVRSDGRQLTLAQSSARIGAVLSPHPLRSQRGRSSPDPHL